MNFKELPKSACFVILQPDREMPLLVKDSKGQARKCIDYLPLTDVEITPDTEVQPVYLKKPSCEE